MKYPFSQQEKISRQDIRTALLLKNHIQGLVAQHYAMVYRLHIRVGFGALFADDVDMNDADRAFESARIPEGYSRMSRASVAADKELVQSDEAREKPDA